MKKLYLHFIQSDLVSRIRVEVAFLLFSLFFGFLYLFLTPLAANFDEPAHMLKVYSLSEFKTGAANIPVPFHTFLKEKHSLVHNPQHHIPDTAQHSLLREDFTAQDVVQVNSADPYFFTSYWPAILTTLFLKAVHPNSYLIFLFARISLFLASTAILYYTIKAADKNQWLFFFVSILPMNLYLRAGVSADSLTYAYSIAYINCFLLSLKHPCNRYFYALLGLGILVSLSKNVYVLITFLALLLPLFPLPSLRSGLLQKTCLILVPLACAALWNGYVISVLHFNPNSLSYIGGFLGGKGTKLPVDPHQQIDFILSHIGYFMIIFFSNIILWLVYFSRSAFGVMDVNQIILLNFNPYNALLVLAAATLLFIPKEHYTTFYRRIFAALCSALLLLLFVILYLNFSKVGSAVIAGVQGRYLLPALPLLALAVQPRHKLYGSHYVIIAGLIIYTLINVEALYRMYIFYYA